VTELRSSVLEPLTSPSSAMSAASAPRGLRTDEAVDARCDEASSVQPAIAKPTIALVAHDIHDQGGMERVCAELIRQGHEEFDFTVVSTMLAPELRCIVRNWTPIRVPARPFPLKFASFWLRASSAVRELDVDIVHTVGAIVPNRVDVASIHFCHGGFVRVQRRLAADSMRLTRRVNTSVARVLALAGERWCYRPGRLRAFAAVSRGVGNEVSEHYPGIPVYVTPNGVDHERFHPDPKAREEVRNANGLREEPVAVFVGGDWDHKGLAIALGALAQVRRQGPDLRLWVVGDGDQERFSALAGELGVAAAVSFLGLRNDVERVLPAADMFVLPSMYETFSLVAFEAAACALPIVATPVHGIVDLLAHEDAGILVDRDAESVGAALARLADDPDLRSRLGRGALARSSSYTWHASAASVIDIYRSLLADRTKVPA
jgi:UDP-glucose:(heptosyl)LPS alpha-1,3-glucosyltransferase